MISTKLIIGIYNFGLETNTEFELFDKVILSNNKSHLDNIFNTETLKNIVGQNELQLLYNNGTFLFSELNFDFDDKDFNEHVHLSNFLFLIELFCQALWLVKDNSVTSQFGHLAYSIKDNPSVYSNLWVTSYTNKFGQFATTYFDNDDLQQAKKLLPMVFAMNHVGEKLDSLIKLSSKQTRLTRALYFLQSARGSNDMGTKLAHYCSVLESIFSVSSFELKHRLSETVALFLSTEKDERIKIYREMQNAYDIRSAIVHGDGVPDKYLKNNFSLLKQIVTSSDHIVRKCLNKIIATNELFKLFTEKTQDDITRFNQSLIFS